MKKKERTTPPAEKSVRRKKGFFSISSVADIFSIHQQTIRLYEREGLINPKRSEGNTRLFSEDDVNKLEEVIYLTHKLGINLAGVQMILKLQNQIKKMQKNMNTMFEETNSDLKKEHAIYEEQAKETVKQLSILKQQQIENPLKRTKKQNTETINSDKEATNESLWKIDYTE